MENSKSQKIIVVGAGPVGCLAALYAASRGHDVELYELRGGIKSWLEICIFMLINL
jgi:kynurenine 3-monooxygenase